MATDRSAYDTLDRYLSDNETNVVEIEILPSTPDGPQSLQDGICFGIQKKVLVQGFVIARQIFDRRTSHTDEDILRASRILLLFDPEHLTAANYRKRRLEMLGITCKPSMEDETLAKAIQRELCFVDSILNSPLHRQTKSPTLWHHRYWVLWKFYPSVSQSSGMTADRTLEDHCNSFLRRDLLVITAASERHPKNYYAWLHGRKLVHLISSIVQGSDSQKLTLENLLSMTCHATYSWCLQHPSDISGWSFLEFLISHPYCDSAIYSQIVTDTLQWALNLNWRQEAVWSFVRTAIAVEKGKSNVSCSTWLAQLNFHCAETSVPNPRVVSTRAWINR